MEITKNFLVALDASIKALEGKVRTTKDLAEYKQDTLIGKLLRSAAESDEQSIDILTGFVIRADKEMTEKKS